MACRKECHSSADAACTSDNTSMPSCGTTLRHCSRMMGPQLDDCEVLMEEEMSLRMELSKQRSDTLHKQQEANHRREALEAQHEEICEELHAALSAQVAVMGPFSMQSSHPRMDQVQDLVRREAQILNDITLLKEELSKEQAYQQREIANMEMAHNSVSNKLSQNLVKRVPYGRTAAAKKEIVPTQYDWISSAVGATARATSQAKEQQLKNEVGEMMKRVQERIETFKQTETSRERHETRSLGGNSAPKLPFAATGMRIREPL